LFREIADRSGNEAVIAESCKAGLKLVEEQRFNLVFLDIDMLAADVVETFISIKDICPDMRVVIMGGTLDGKLMSSVLPYGSFSVLNKPLRDSDILQIINSVVRG
jgi:DNA-binding NtrC family response regulator